MKSLMFVLLICISLIGYGQTYNLKNNIWVENHDSDVIWRMTVIRYIDLDSAANRALKQIYKEEEKEETTLLDVLFNHIVEGQIIAYSNELPDTQHLANEEIIPIRAQVAAGLTKHNGLLLQEDVIFDRSKGRMTTFLHAIGPTLKMTDTTSQTLFWVDYSECRMILKHYYAINKNRNRVPISDWFENRLFNSRIISAIPPPIR